MWCPVAVSVAFSCLVCFQVRSIFVSESREGSPKRPIRRTHDQNYSRVRRGESTLHNTPFQSLNQNSVPGAVPPADQQSGQGEDNHHGKQTIGIAACSQAMHMLEICRNTPTVIPYCNYPQRVEGGSVVWWKENFKVRFDQSKKDGFVGCRS